MSPPDHRHLTSRLADDLAYLERHAASRAETGEADAARLRLAAALVRNSVGPFLDGQVAEPLHVAVVGGAGTGKSTVANFLIGSGQAEANAQAGFTRHPIAYAEGGMGPAKWASHLGFLGPLSRLGEATGSNLDEDVYQVRTVSDGGPAAVTDRFVVWDCPDMTTWAAVGYVSRLTEVAALADVIVHVASDERYNDRVPTEFLHTLIRAGKPIVVVLTKMRPSQADDMIEHFRGEVLGRAPGGKVAAVPVLAVPNLTADQLADPAGKAGEWRIPLLNQVGVLGEPPDAARRRTVTGASSYLLAHADELLAPAEADLQALDGWRDAVRAGQADFDSRYRKEYLESEPYRRFDEARESLLGLIELPNAGRLWGALLWLVRSPYRLIKSLVGQAVARPESVNLPEQEVLEAARGAWLDGLRSEALRRAGKHPLWKHLAQGFQSGHLDGHAQERFRSDLRRYELTAADHLERSRRSITEGLAKNTGLLAGIRIGKLALVAAAIGVAFWACGLSLFLLLGIPVAASLSHQVAESAAGQFVARRRELARVKQEGLMGRYLSAPLAEWLVNWPVTGGSDYEKLQRAARRVPESVRELDAAVRERLRRPTDD